MGTRICLLILSALLWTAGCGNDNSPTGVASGCGLSDNNAPPVITMQPDTVASIGDTLFLAATAVDPDGDAIGYGAIIDVPWSDARTGGLPRVNMDAATGRFWFAPQLTDPPGRRISFVADDGRCGRDTTAFYVSVADAAR